MFNRVACHSVANQVSLLAEQFREHRGAALQCRAHAARLTLAFTRKLAPLDGRIDARDYISRRAARDRPQRECAA